MMKNECEWLFSCFHKFIFDLYKTSEIVVFKEISDRSIKTSLKIRNIDIRLLLY